ncbi:unnamed protein product, partial [Closterium sp. Yama58-4]
DLSYNNFHGRFPSGLLQRSLKYLDVSNNFLSGELPRTLSANPFLYMLSLGGNGFTGSLPNFSRWNVSCVQINFSGNNFTGSIPDSISTLTNLEGIILNNNQLTGTIPSALFTMTNLNYLMISNNYLYGPLPDCLFDNCINQIDVSSNSLYGRINRDFKSMVADGGALINLANNFFFGEAVLFAAGCKVCPTEVSEPNKLDLEGTLEFNLNKCTFIGENIPPAWAGREVRVSLLGNCLTLSPNTECSSNATQRSTRACQTFCSITDNGPCDGHGACVPPAPASSSNFTCLCDAGYSTLNSGNGSTCAIVNSTTTTTTVPSLSTGAIVGIVLGCFAGFTLLAAVVVWLMWPRGPKKWEGLDVCEQFSLQQMLSATNSWSEDNVLGKGGFGIVYKGRSPQGHLWAIKRSTIMTNDFEKEVADFGLLKRLTHGDADATRVAGTPGYVDPDYVRTHVITAKSDIYSFGIVLLQLLSGKTPQVDGKTHISKWAVKLVEAYELGELRDSKMPAASEEAIVDFADLALDCIKSPGTRRPTMKDVAYRLSALIDKEDARESVAKDEGARNQDILSKSASP